jgi:MYXO-CTERM domain-containing protein
MSRHPAGANYSVKASMKKNFNNIAAALVFAGSALVAQAAQAAPIDISQLPEAVTLAAGTAHFDDTFANGNAHNLFNDQFTFTTTGVSNVDMILTSISTKATNGLDLTGFALYNSNSNAVVLAGTQLKTGLQDKWTLTVNSLAAGSYYFKVSGNVVSATGGAFAGNGHVLSAVPEADTYAMLLAGLGLLGVVARRRSNAA